MILFPAIDLMDGNVVKLEAKHHRRPEKVYGAPGPVAERWLAAGAEWLHVVDLNAALGDGMPNHLALLSILPRIARYRARLQWGGGVRDGTTLRLLLEAGMGDTGGSIARVIVGTRAIRDWAWLAGQAETYPDRIVVAIDAAGLDIVVGGWQERSGVDVRSFLARCKDLPIAAFLHTNVKVEGKGEGVDWEPVRAILESSPKPVIFSGGVSSNDDVARFKDLKAYGIILGSAIYSNEIDFTAAKAIAQG